MEINLVELWLRKDPVRWLAGALSGVFAGIMMIAVGAVIALAGGKEVWMPLKLAASPILGSGALEFGAHFLPIFVGLLVIEFVCGVLGAIYAHFTATNHLPSLIGMGLVWGIFGWIFINNLFIPAFPTISAAAVPQGVALPIYLVFGIALTSVVFFDHLLRGERR